jgi:hypothetical protein
VSYSLLSAFLRFSPAAALGAAPRLTAFTGLIRVPGLITGGTFGCAVPRGAGDTRQSFSFSPDDFASDGSEDDTMSVFDADCCNGIVVVVVVTTPFCSEDSEGGVMDDKEGAEGSEAEIGAGASGASTRADSVANSGGGT